MPKKVRSAKGEIVDFDLMKIKEQMANAPEPTNVEARQDFIDQKMRRRLKKIRKKIDEAPLRGRQKSSEPVEVDKKVAVESTKQEEKIDEVVTSENAAPKKTSKTKRKIKKKTTKKAD